MCPSRFEPGYWDPGDCETWVHQEKKRGSENNDRLTDRRLVVVTIGGYGSLCALQNFSLAGSYI